MTSMMSRPDSELAFAAITMTVLTLLAYWLGQRWRLQSQRAENGVLLASVGLAFWLAWSYFGRLVWAETIASSSALYWSNMTPVALGLTSGLVGHSPGLRRHVRPVITGCLMALAAGYVAAPIARPIIFPIELEDHVLWRNGVCLQSHAASCAPAAAVTLLHQHEIDARESELAEVCLTSTLGTAPLGLYRGLRTIASEHGYHALVARHDPAMWVSTGQLPNVSIVKFESVPGEPIRNRFLGSQTSGHVVTVLGRTDGGRWLIGDPAVGKISWSDAEFRRRFTGEAIYLSR